jgi:hypothetical protein
MKSNHLINHCLKNLRTILALIVLNLSMGAAAKAQNEGPLKNMRFGIRVTPEVSWMKPADEKTLEFAGAKIKLGYALMTEFKLNKVVCLATGLAFEKNGGTINYLDDNVRYYYKQDSPVESTTPQDTATRLFKLSKREFSINYLSIPLCLKMRTKEIGLMTYFAQVGVNLGIRTKSVVNDEENIDGLTKSLDKIVNTTDIGFFKAAINVGLGAEYSLAGTTALLVSVNYLNGLTNIAKKTSDYLFVPNGIERTPYKQNFSNNGVSLSVGVLF